MTSSHLKTFRALLEPDGTRLRWTIARIPFDIAKAWPERRGRRVRGSVDGIAFRTSLFPDRTGEGHFLLVNRKMQQAAGARQGDRVRIEMEPDLEERESLMPEELARAMKAAPGLRKWFDRLSPSMRRDIGKYAADPKSSGSRMRRAEQIAEWLYLAMEGEKEPPPILRAAFQRQPLVKIGWEAMTPAQRRGHLLGIFHSRTGEGREKRMQAAISDALKAAKRVRAAGPAGLEV